MYKFVLLRNKDVSILFKDSVNTRFTNISTQYETTLAKLIITFVGSSKCELTCLKFKTV